MRFSRAKLTDQYWPRLRRCVADLSDDQIWWRPNHASNSVGILLLHLNGNVSQWVLGTLGRIPIARKRPAEFEDSIRAPSAQLLEPLAATMEAADRILADVSETDLAAVFHVQGYRVTGLEVVYHVVEHFGMHYGQIVYITKMLRAVSLGFCGHLDGIASSAQSEVP